MSQRTTSSNRDIRVAFHLEFFLFERRRIAAPGYQLHPITSNGGFILMPSYCSVVQTLREPATRFGCPVNMPGPSRKPFRLRPVMAFAARVEPEQAGSCMPDQTSCLRLGSVFSKEGPDHIVPYRPGSDLNGLSRFCPNASGPGASRCSGSSGRVPLKHSFQTQ